MVCEFGEKFSYSHVPLSLLVKKQNNRVDAFLVCFVYDSPSERVTISCLHLTCFLAFPFRCFIELAFLGNGISSGTEK